MRRALPFVLLLVLPQLARALPSGQLSAGSGLTLVAGPNVEANLGLTASATLAIDPQIVVGVLGFTSRHNVAPDFEHLGLTYLALHAEWRLDLAPLIPVLGVGVGLLVLRANADPPSNLLAYHLTAGLDWWIGEPLRGVALGAEVRYLGVTGAFPVTTTLGVRMRYGF